MAEDKGPQLPPGLKAAIEAMAKVPNIKQITFPTIDLSGLAKAHANAMAVFPELQRQFAAQSQPMTELQRQLANIRFPSDEVMRHMADAAKRMQSLYPSLQPSPEQLRVFEQLAKTDRRKKALDRIGVLPHASTPLALLDGEESDDDLRAILEKHYRERWSGVSQDVLERSHRFSVDAEAKAALAEAVEAHQNGHYRSVCRLLLPEIERVTRVELLGNEVGTIHVDKVVGGPAMDLPISETTPAGYYALGLYERLTDHLYVKVGAANRGNFERDLVPNRHAAIHGLIVYNSFWHSLNTIFMTDFAFQVVSAIKQLGAADENSQ
jgi:uncharacterized coiled-coil protein SlyX